jgi:hypothetical protein
MRSPRHQARRTWSLVSAQMRREAKSDRQAVTGALRAGTFSYGTAGFRAKAVRPSPNPRDRTTRRLRGLGLGCARRCGCAAAGLQDTLASTVFRSGVLIGLRALHTKACTGT